MLTQEQLKNFRIKKTKDYEILTIHIDDLHIDEEMQRDIEINWIKNLATKFKGYLAGMPIVWYSDGKLYLLDGYQRREKARRDGEFWLDCAVYSGIHASNPKKRREAFIVMNRDRKKLPPHAVYKNLYKNGDPVAVAMWDSCPPGRKFASSSGPGKINCYKQIDQAVRANVHDARTILLFVNDLLRGHIYDGRVFAGMFELFSNKKITYTDFSVFKTMCPKTILLAAKTDNTGGWDTGSKAANSFLDLLKLGETAYLDAIPHGLSGKKTVVTAQLTVHATAEIK